MAKASEFLHMMAAAMACQFLPVRKTARQPIAYSYNGVVLPGLPEWDREMYPYVAITHSGIDDQGSADKAYLYLFTTEIYRDIADSYVGFCIRGSGDGSAIRYKIDKENGITGWSLDESFSKTYSANGQIFLLGWPVSWANHNVLTTSGTIYCGKSEPVPVYE